MPRTVSVPIGLENFQVKIVEKFLDKVWGYWFSTEFFRCLNRWQSLPVSQDIAMMSNSVVILALPKFLLGGDDQGRILVQMTLDFVSMHRCNIPNRKSVVKLISILLLALSDGNQLIGWRMLPKPAR